MPGQRASQRVVPGDSGGNLATRSKVRGLRYPIFLLQESRILVSKETCSNRSYGPSFFLLPLRLFLPS